MWWSECYAISNVLWAFVELFGLGNFSRGRPRPARLTASRRDSGLRRSRLLHFSNYRDAESLPTERSA